MAVAAAAALVGGRGRLPHHLGRPEGPRRRLHRGHRQPSLFQNWVLPFEALSVLLLAALVGDRSSPRKAKADATTTADAATPAGAQSRRSEKEGTLTHLADPAVLSALLFCTGLYGVLARRNAILVLMSVELMLDAVNLNLVAFDVWLSRTARDTLHSGQALTLFTVAIAAAEIGIGLAIVLACLPGPRQPRTSTSSATPPRAPPRTAPTATAPKKPPSRETRRLRPPRDHDHLRRPRPSFRSWAPRPDSSSARTVPGYVRPLAVLPSLTALVLAVLVAVRQGGGQAINAATELTPTGSVPIELALHIDGFAALVAVLVGVVASCVQIYSTGYLRDDPRYPSYAALISLFTSAMLLVVYSGDLIVLLVGWEVMGICSYFLVGHYWETPEARAASIKAFLVTKLGDVPFLIGLFALATDAGLLPHHHGPRHRPRERRTAPSDADRPAAPRRRGGQAALFPLHTWLPDAMAGPTPVSALIHAATMSPPGSTSVARLLPVFQASSAAMVVLAVMAAVTMAGSALAALAQDDIKRVLAYSTIGQLGYMAGALAVGDRGAAVFHLLSHGAFKALLFLAAA